MNIIKKLTIIFLIWVMSLGAMPIQDAHPYISIGTAEIIMFGAMFDIIYAVVTPTSVRFVAIADPGINLDHISIRADWGNLHIEDEQEYFEANLTDTNWRVQAVNGNLEIYANFADLGYRIDLDEFLGLIISDTSSEENFALAIYYQELLNFFLRYLLEWDNLHRMGLNTTEERLWFWIFREGYGRALDNRTFINETFSHGYVTVELMSTVSFKRGDTLYTYLLFNAHGIYTVDDVRQYMAIAEIYIDNGYGPKGRRINIEGAYLDEKTRVIYFTTVLQNHIYPTISSEDIISKNFEINILEFLSGRVSVRTQHEINFEEIVGGYIPRFADVTANTLISTWSGLGESDMVHFTNFETVKEVAIATGMLQPNRLNIPLDAGVTLSNAAVVGNVLHTQFMFETAGHRDIWVYIDRLGWHEERSTFLLYGFEVYIEEMGVIYLEDRRFLADPTNLSDLYLILVNRYFENVVPVDIWGSFSSPVARE